MEFVKTTLGELSIDGKGSYGIASSAVPYDEKLFTYLRITDINDNGTLNKSGLMSVNDSKAKKYLLKPNDIVFARTGNSTGRNYFYDGTDGNFVFAGFLIKFSIDEKKSIHILLNIIVFHRDIKIGFVPLVLVAQEVILMLKLMRICQSYYHQENNKICLLIYYLSLIIK